MEVKDTTYIPQEAKQMDLKMSIEKYGASITIEVRDRVTDETVYFLVGIEQVQRMIIEG